jgi:hypothetical protein
MHYLRFGVRGWLGWFGARPIGFGSTRFPKARATVSEGVYVPRDQVISSPVDSQESMWGAFT